LPKRRVKAKLRDDRRPAQRVNETWTMDFVHDQLATGRKVRVLTIVDTFTRCAPAIEPRFGYQAGDVIGVPERVGREHGFPQAIRVDPGSGFVSRDLALWAYQRGVTLDFSGRAADGQRVHHEPKREVRADCLNAHWFMSRGDVRAQWEVWRRD
jgi:putative transposase